MDIYRRTYEPLKFTRTPLGRLFWVPLPVTSHTRAVSYSATWEDTGNRWGPTLVTRIPFTRWAVGLGVWLNAPQDVMMVHEADAEFDAYVAVNGGVSREDWNKARETVASMDLDPSDEMEIMQSLGLFE